MLRGLIKILLGNLYKYDASQDKFDFSKLTFIDKIMACKLLKYVVQVTKAYEKFQLKKVYDLTLRFLSEDFAEFYLPISRERLMMREGSVEHLSSQMIYSKVLMVVMQALAPILPLTT